MTVYEWYVARAGGVIAFGLLTLAVVLGLMLSGRASLRSWPRFAIEELHRFVGLLTVAFVFVHLLALLVDTYLPFSLTQLIVPGASSYRPLATALGVVAAELLLALAIANRFRKRLSYRFWRRANYLNFAVWLLSIVHGLTAGTDAGSPWATALYVVSAAAVAGLLVWRTLKPPALAASRGSIPT